MKGYFMKTAWLFVYVFAASSIFGQGADKPQPVSGSAQPVAFRGRGFGTNGPGGSSHGNAGFWLERKVTNPEYMQKVGITDEQAKNLRAAWKKIEEQSQKVEEEIHLLAREQAELAKKVLAAEGSDTKELMAQIEKIGKLRIEQAKLAMQRVILIRDHLTPAQRTKLNTMLEEDQIKWRAAREESARKRETTPEAGQKK
jgi:Spy/CpxP family protein refolding chaperone